MERPAARAPALRERFLNFRHFRQFRHSFDPLYQSVITKNRSKSKYDKVELDI